LTRLTTDSLSRAYSDLAWAWRSEPRPFTDVILIAEGRRFPAHKVVLCARSEYFRALLASGLKESRQDEVTMSDIGPDVLDILLGFLYRNMLPLEDDTSLDGDRLVSLLIAANRFGVAELTAQLEDVIAANLDEANVLGLLLLADQHGAPRLVRSCRAFISSPEHLKSVATSTEFHSSMTELDRVLGQDFLLRQEAANDQTRQDEEDEAKETAPDEEEDNEDENEDAQQQALFQQLLRMIQQGGPPRPAGAVAGDGEEGDQEGEEGGAEGGVEGGPGGGGPGAPPPGLLNLLRMIMRGGAPPAGPFDDEPAEEVEEGARIEEVDDGEVDEDNDEDGDEDEDHLDETSAGGEKDDADKVD